MAFALTDLVSLETAIADGTLECRIGDKIVKFPSFEDLRARYAFIKSELEALGLLSAPSGINQRTALVAHSRD